MKTQTTPVSTADGPMDLYEALPDGAPRGAIVVVQEAFGVNDHIQDVTRRFAAAGYRAVAPAFFHRAGGGTAPYTDFSKVMPLFKGVTDDAMLMDVDAALAHLHAQGFRDAEIGLVGFCFGGRVSFLVATRRKLGAVVGFYGGGIVAARRPGFPTLIGDSSKLGSPWLGLFGDKDQGIPNEDVAQLRATLDRETQQPHEVVLYEGAEHGFHCDVRASYHEKSAKDAWARTLEWFAKYLAKR
ncbi:MAG TPA: dienelactone hydrolase family protein [Myxococcota bacterium]|nr:dienelactone hydrolase family protein [Myxococcota bacterium]